MAEILIRSVVYLRDLSRCHEDWENDGGCLCAEWAADTIEKLQDALQELYDWQNGPPLSSPKWKEGWGGAMAKAEAVLKELEGRSDDQG